MPLLHTKAASVFLRLLIVLPILLWLAQTFAGNYARLVMPLYLHELRWLAEGFQVQAMEVIQTYEYLFKVTYVVNTLTFVNGQMIHGGAQGLITTSVDSALIHPVMLAAAALAWPGLTRAQRGGRLLISLPILITIEMIDVPIVLYSSIHDLLSRTYDSGYAATTHLNLDPILQGGGRYALCIAGAFLAAEMQRKLNRMLQRSTEIPSDSNQIDR